MTHNPVIAARNRSETSAQPCTPLGIFKVKPAEIDQSPQVLQKKCFH